MKWKSAEPEWVQETVKYMEAYGPWASSDPVAVELTPNLKKDLLRHAIRAWDPPEDHSNAGPPEEILAAWESTVYSGGCETCWFEYTDFRYVVRGARGGEWLESESGSMEEVIQRITSLDPEDYQ